MLTVTELSETLSSARHSLFRLETLDRYEVPSYQAAREVVWSMAEEFTSWWAAHPQYHRENYRVA